MGKIYSPFSKIKLSSGGRPAAGERAYLSLASYSNLKTYNLLINKQNTVDSNQIL